jgi:hypothetical protein
LEAQKDVITAQEAQHKKALAKLEAENAALKAQTASAFTEILAAVTTGAMEILPVRPDSRQFVEWRVGGIPPPPPPEFDRTWCAAVCAGGWKADISAGAENMCATITQNGLDSCTLRSAAPLPRSPSPRRGASGGQQLPMYRVIVEAYGARGSCYLGFVPSHHTHRAAGATAVAPSPHYGIYNYGGWLIEVQASRRSEVDRALYSG